jgi:hypothetical protein
MEARKITIVSTKNQSKKVIMSSAETLSELKADLRQNGIDYEGMTFYEGTAKVELKDDSSFLPKDVQYKGTTTNELVFMLTNTNKKIKSGALSRSEVYAKIKENGLQSKCVEVYGKNYTMCKTNELISLLEKNNKPRVTRRTAKKKTDVVENPTNKKFKDTTLRDAFIKLVVILQDSEVIFPKEVEDIMSHFNNELDLSSYKKDEDFEDSYSDSEIEDMFDFVKQ